METHVDGVARVGLLESARNRDGRAGVDVAAAGDGDLGAGDVELGDTRRPRVVDAELLDAEQVVSWRDARRNRSSVVSWREKIPLGQFRASR